MERKGGIRKNETLLWRKWGKRKEEFKAREMFTWYIDNQRECIFRKLNFLPSFCGFYLSFFLYNKQSICIQKLLWVLYSQPLLLTYKFAGYSVPTRVIESWRHWKVKEKRWLQKTCNTDDWSSLLHRNMIDGWQSWSIIFNCGIWFQSILVEDWI